ncbi:MAG: DNA topoisomerase (ATP-hydrolyzing) subunit B [Mollicutes bacterium]|nr:DNA topoisomerase (ATP-hydrolyzing) subunit B [Mollicutes bacterium]
MNKETQHYNENDIQVLEGLEAVRRRPGMYIGTTSSRGLHHLVWEIVDNAIDEALAGYCDDIEIIINEDNSVTIKDDGRGIPTGIHHKTGISTVETVYTILHAGGKFGGGGYKVSGGLHGVGASVVNALSSWVEVTVYQDEKVYFIRFENGGKSVEPLKVIDKCSKERTGTMVTFKPDPEIFKETTVFDYDILKTRVRELAFLNKGLRIILCDDRGIEKKKEEFLYNGGLKEYVHYLNRNYTPLHDEIYIEGIRDNITIEVALQYNDTYNNLTLSFVNNINTGDGGTHEEGVRSALTRIINNYAREYKFLKENDESLTGDDVREGLTIVVSCKHPDPQFEGQTKGRLGNGEVRKVASDIFGEGFERSLMENPDVAKKIMEKAIQAARARIAAKKARELSRTRGGLDLTNQWGKLADCSSKNPLERELFIVEGDSAMGSAKLGRNPQTQAILPIKGKILNVEKSRLDKILSNEEIRSIITALGTSIGDEFDINKLRYNKIILMTDADVDGSHIRTLLLTLLYRFFRPLIEEGHVYAAQPPLYKISHGKTTKYVLNDREKEEYINSLPEEVRSKVNINRQKGLGEMDAIDLRNTTMDIEQRILLKINIEDAILADEMFTILMGEEVAPRRKFIEENALSVRNLDI